MKVLVVGQTGQLARALSRLALVSKIDLTCLSRSDLDLILPKDSILDYLSTLTRPDLIIMAAAYTAVDMAEDDTAAAKAINTDAPAYVAQYCYENSVAFVHISTDYVFAGDANISYREDDEASPINMYGQTKYEGELAVFASRAKAAVVRTSWVYDGTGKNFLTTMLRLAQTRDELSVVADQIGRPTYAGDLAAAALKLGQRLIKDVKNNTQLYCGLYHFSNSGQPISWAEFATQIFNVFSDQISGPIKINHISTQEYPTPAKRPYYSVLNISKFEQVCDHTAPDWQTGLKSAYQEFLTNREK